MIHFVGSSEYACRALVTAADCNARGEGERDHARDRERAVGRDSIEESRNSSPTKKILASSSGLAAGWFHHGVTAQILALGPNTI